MKYYKGNLKCPHCGSKDNQSFTFGKKDIDMENRTIIISAGCGVIRTIEHYMGLTPNCGKPYVATMKMTNKFYKLEKKKI